MERSRRSTAIAALLLAVLSVTAWAIMRLTTVENVLLPRPDSWAQPVEVPGVPGLYRLSDDLYRSGQPSAEGMANLEAMGVKTIVNLRLLASDRDAIEGTGLDYVHIQMEAWQAEDEEVVEFLKVVTDPDRVPALVHCSYGADRTGLMCAVYRIVVQGWSKEEAVREMTLGGFGFHQIWANLHLWVSALDVEEIRAQAGLAGGAVTRAPPSFIAAPTSGTM